MIPSFPTKVWKYIWKGKIDTAATKHIENVHLIQLSKATGFWLWSKGRQEPNVLAKLSKKKRFKYICSKHIIYTKNMLQIDQCSFTNISPAIIHITITKKNL